MFNHFENIQIIQESWLPKLPNWTVEFPASKPLISQENKEKLTEIVSDSVLCGGAAGSVGILVTQPLDVIRIRLQTNSAVNKSITNCGRLIWKNEGLRGLWKGVCSPVFGSGICNALIFCGYETMECALTNGYQRKPEMNDWVTAGAFSGIFSSIATGPTELVSRIAAVDVNSKGTLRDEMNIVKKIWRSHGVSGFFQGLGLTAARDSLFFVSYFSIYKGLLPEENPSIKNSFLAGGIAGSVSWGMLHPIDVIKTRWQIAPKGEFASPMQLVKHCYRREGARFMLQGINATIVRAFPQHAVTFVVYEYLSKLRAQNSCL